ncbi:hypothetical protein [Virgibacillus sp. YIM 98842]|uniref:hypothetical protein n=1 Tax=Virgibacillus sp. YIM 98842 TaxID=2663533 RepID=UPI0013DAFD63|nr:hypothetical protein [Virgibacillus sp. YIM 98842]
MVKFNTALYFRSERGTYLFRYLAISAGTAVFCFEPFRSLAYFSAVTKTIKLHDEQFSLSHFDLYGSDNQ